MLTNGGKYWQALIPATDHEIYVALTCIYNEKYEGLKGAVGTQLVGERAKVIVDELHKLGLLTHRQCLEHIGIIFLLRLHFCVCGLLAMFFY